MIVVVIVGLLAAMAVPVFQKIRENSQQKTILNNLRQIAAAGQQYILSEGVTSVDYADLTPTYFADMQTVANEDYTLITITDTGTITATPQGRDPIDFNY